MSERGFLPGSKAWWSSLCGHERSTQSVLRAMGGAPAEAKGDGGERASRDAGGRPEKRIWGRRRHPQHEADRANSWWTDSGVRAFATDPVTCEPATTDSLRARPVRCSPPDAVRQPGGDAGEGTERLSAEGGPSTGPQRVSTRWAGLLLPDSYFSARRGLEQRSAYVISQQPKSDSRSTPAILDIAPAERPGGRRQVPNDLL
jgi:hypothetical protein